MLMDMCLPKFDIYQSPGTLNYFKSYTNSLCLNFFQKTFCLMSDLKFTLSDTTSFLPNNLSVVLKNIYSGSHCIGFLPVQCCPNVLRQDCTWLFLRNVVWSLSDNTAKGFNLCNIVPRAFPGRTEKTLCSVVLQAPDNIA